MPKRTIGILVVSHAYTAIPNQVKCSREEAEGKRGVKDDVLVVLQNYKPLLNEDIGLR